MTGPWTTGVERTTGVDGDLAMIADRFEHRPVSSRERVFDGRIFDVVRDVVDLGPEGSYVREVIDHPGAVAVVALDDQGRVAVIDQYRHAVQSILWEIPAGLLDIDGEDALVGAQRELAEEADLRAATWHLLLDFLTSPGCTNEVLRVYLARDLTLIPEHERHVRHEEEAEWEVHWVPLDDLVAGALAGRLHNPNLVVGVLAAARARDANWQPLRPADSPFPYRRSPSPNP